MSRGCGIPRRRLPSRGIVGADEPGTPSVREEVTPAAAAPESRCPAAAAASDGGKDDSWTSGSANRLQALERARCLCFRRRFA